MFILAAWMVQREPCNKEVAGRDVKCNESMKKERKKQKKDVTRFSKDKINKWETYKLMINTDTDNNTFMMLLFNLRMFGKSQNKAASGLLRNSDKS